MSKKRSHAAASPTDNTKKRRHVDKRRRSRKALPSTSDSASPHGDQSDAPPFPHDHDSPTTASSSSSASEEPRSTPLSAENPSSAAADIPCIECAERAFQECDDGIIRPNYCIFENPGERCMRCWENGQDCESLPQAFRSMFGRLLALNPDSEALAAAEDFAVELKKTLEIIGEENSTATQLKVLNRTLLLLLNDRREAASKKLLGEEHLVEWTRGWDTAKKRLGQKHGLYTVCLALTEVIDGSLSVTTCCDASFSFLAAHPSPHSRDTG
ncbi:hypothetical protein BJX65DRAFT_314163 [Aspergillus insuetus]